MPMYTCNISFKTSHGKRYFAGTDITESEYSSLSYTDKRFFSRKLGQQFDSYKEDTPSPAYTPIPDSYTPPSYDPPSDYGSSSSSDSGGTDFGGGDSGGGGASGDW